MRLDYCAAPIAETCALGKVLEAYRKVAAGAAGRILLRPQDREAAMIGFLVSLGRGLAVGIAYGFLHVRSPAPPLIALIGLLGMVLGEQAVSALWPQIVPPAHSAVQQSPPDPAGPAR